MQRPETAWSRGSITEGWWTPLSPRTYQRDNGGITMTLKPKEGDRVRANKLGYGHHAGELITGTVIVGTFGDGDYIRVRWDDGDVDFGFTKHFRNLVFIKGEQDAQ